MGLTDRNAPNDTPLERAVISENIDVAKPGRFYPEDFSGQLQAVQQKQALLAEIPKSLANIVEHTNDYKINMWSEEQDRALFTQGQRNELFQKEMEQKLALDTKNSVTDMYMQMKDVAFTRLTEADRNREDLSTAMQEVYAQFENPTEFEGNWEAQKLWRETLKHDQTEVLPKLWEEDLNKAKWLAQKNMSDIMNSQYALVRSGKVKPFDAMNSILHRLIIQGHDLGSRELQTSLNTVYNTLVPAYAEYIVDMQKRGIYSDEKAYLALLDLRETCESAWFDCVGVDGKRLSNSDGSLMQLNLVLSSEAQNRLYHVFAASKGASGSAGTALKDYIDGYKKEMGYESIQKYGSSDRLARFASTLEVTNEFENIISHIQQSKATDAQKANAIRDLMPIYAAGYNTVMIRDIAKQSKGDAVRVLGNMLATLKSDIAEGKVGLDYKLQEDSNGNAYSLFSLPIDPANPILGNSDAAARLYWESTADVLQKQYDILQNQGEASFLHHFDHDYTTIEQKLFDHMQASTLLARKAPGDQSPTAIDTGVALINELHKKAEEYGIHKQRVTTDLLEGMLALVQDPKKGFDTPTKQMEGILAISEMFTMADESNTLIRYMNKNLSNETGQTLYLAQAIQGIGATDKTLAAKMKSYLTVVKHDPKERELISSRIEKVNGSTMTNTFDDTCTDKKIPASHRADGRINILKQFALEYAAYTTGDADRWSKTFKTLIDAMYVQPPKGSGLNESIYRYSPQYLPFVKAGKEKEFFEVAAHTKDMITTVFENSELPDLAKGIRIVSDDENEVFRFKIKDKDVEAYDVQNGKYKYPAIPGVSYFETYRPSVVAKLAGANVLAAYLASNDEEYKQYIQTLTKVGADGLSKKRSIVDKALLATGKALLDNDTSNVDKAQRISATTVGVPISAISTTLMDKLQNSEQWTYLRDALGTPYLRQALRGSLYLGRAILDTNENISDWVRRTEDKPSTPYPQQALEGSLYLGRAILDTYENTSDWVRRTGDMLAPLSDPSRSPIFAPLLYNKYMHGETTGQAADITFEDIATAALADSSYVGKIKQSDISEPIAHAAVGNENYIDVYNTCSSLNYKITNTHLPGVTSEYSGPTGFAAPLESPIVRNQVPTATGRAYTKQEIMGLVDYYADVFGIGRNLARALVNQESGGQQYVKSHAGAIGVMQLMPATAKGLGVTNPEDAAQNIWGGMKYLHSMLKQFNGDIPLALAAYNAGPGAVQKAKGIPNYPETKAYVKNICSKAGISIDGKQYPVTIGLAQNKAKFIDPDTNSLNPKEINNLVQAVSNASCFKDKVVNITTNRPELLENKPEYADFKAYRDARTSDGRPLFVKGDVDGFSINMKKEGDGQLNPAAITALAEDAAATQTSIIPQVSTSKLEALLTTAAPKYSQIIGESMGLAGLSISEYEEYGVPISAVHNPVMQARVLAQEFQRAIDILGNERKAVYALVGGQMADEKGEIKTWSEIKQDKENFTKNWYIKPTLDDKKREEVNALVSMYNTICNRNRGM